MTNTKKNYKPFIRYATTASFPQLEQFVTNHLWLTTFDRDEVPKRSRNASNGGNEYNRYQYLKALIRTMYDNAGVVHVSLDNNHYAEVAKAGNAPTYYTRRYAKAVIEALVAAGVAELHKGFVDSEGKTPSTLVILGEPLDRMSAVRAVVALSTSVQDNDEPLPYAMIPERFRKYLPANYERTDSIVVRRKDSKGVRREVPFTMTPRLNQFSVWMNDLEETYTNRGINITYRKAETREHAAPTLKFHSSIPERVLQLADKTGGYRFYHRLQFITKETERPTVTINGEPTADVDMVSCHMAILYAIVERKQYDAQSDYYTPVLAALGVDVDCSESRKVIKTLTNIALNAEDTTSAMRAYHQTIHSLGLREYSDRLMGIQRSGNVIISRELEMVELINLIKQSHAPISAYFTADVGVRLMAIEAHIMRDIIDRLWFIPPEIAKTPVIPIHDGMLVPMSDVESAKVAMRESFNAITQRYTVEDLVA